MCHNYLMKWEDSFIEPSIPGHKFLLGDHISQFIALLTLRITQEYTRYTSGLKLIMIFGRVASKCKAPNDPQMIIRG